MGEVARIDWKPARAPAIAVPDRGAASPTFARFLAEVATASDASDKAAVVDRLLAAAPSGPLLDPPDHVVFLYRGDAADVGIITDLIGARREDPMRRVPGTDLFFHEGRLEAGARVSYQFVRNFDVTGPDPRNPRKVPAAFGGEEASSVSVPPWKEPEHVTAAPARTGRLEALEAVSASWPGAKAPLHVYVPAGYDVEPARYPVAYVFGGAAAREQGLMPGSLDNLIPHRVAPVLVVFIGPVDWGARRPRGGAAVDAATSDLLAKDLVPLVDGRFRTRAEPSGRAVLGAGQAGVAAALAGFQHPELFGGVGLQSVLLLDTPAGNIRSHVRTASERPMRVYLDWGRYGHASAREGADLREANRRFGEFLRERGYRPAGGEALDGFGWASWRNRTDRLFETLFPPGQALLWWKDERIFTAATREGLQ
jgi:enterochelin esterase-like enzyme